MKNNSSSSNKSVFKKYFQLIFEPRKTVSSNFLQYNFHIIITLNNFCFINFFFLICFNLFFFSGYITVQTIVSLPVETKVYACLMYFCIYFYQYSQLYIRMSVCVCVCPVFNQPNKQRNWLFFSTNQSPESYFREIFYIYLSLLVAKRKKFLNKNGKKLPFNIIKL